MKYSCYGCEHAPYKRDYPCTTCGKYVLAEDGEGTVYVYTNWRPKERELRKEVHELKILPRYFEEIVKGSKTFEVRKDDRDFKVGDWLKLKEYDIDRKRFTGDYVMTPITYILGRNEDEKMYVPDGYIILGIKLGI